MIVSSYLATSRSLMIAHNCQSEQNRILSWSKDAILRPGSQGGRSGSRFDRLSVIPRLCRTKMWVIISLEQSAQGPKVELDRI